MAAKTEMRFDGVEQRSLREFTEKAYLDYSMYVILDRALPHVGDGLKPVQRRIIYAMSELGLSNAAKYKKSARTVGDVLGKYHPHGDSACYEAMVLMAQHFSYRYPMVDGQGNWGSQDDPKSFAAMRYTESRLSSYAALLLAEVNQGTVPWGLNFDGTLEEPRLLPAQVPNVLLNGATGIAVGMATDIPPHNLSETITACIQLLDDPKTSLDALCDILPAPDYPSGAEIITPRADIKQMYREGHGSIKMRATYTYEECEIIIHALPHQVSGAKILEQIAAQMQAKKLPMIADLRDESDHENDTRLVIVTRSNRVDMDELMSHLFASTDLERNYRVNMNVIGLNGKPQIKSLDALLHEWLNYRRELVTRRLTHRLEKVLARLHILDALLVAYLNIDEVIAIIRHDEEPKATLIKQYALSDKQAEAILELRLRQLARLEEIKIKTEQSALSDERAELEKTLASKQRLKTLIRNELTAIATNFGDKRRTALVARQEAKSFSLKQVVSADPVTVVLSAKGWVRCAKGHELDPSQMSYKAGDEYLASAQVKNNQLVIFIDTTGRSYVLPAFDLPSARGQGEPLSGKLSPPSGATFAAVLGYEADQKFLLLTNAGYGFICSSDDLQGKNKNGKQIIRLTEKATLLPPMRVASTGLCAMASSKGALLVIDTETIPRMAKGKGQKLIRLSGALDKDTVQSACLLTNKTSLVITAGKRSMQLTAKQLEAYIDERATTGRLLPKTFQKALTLHTE